MLNMCNRITLFCLLSASAVVVALPDGQSETTKLTGQVGKTLTIDTGLQVDDIDDVVLSRGSDRRLLLKYHDGKLEFTESCFHLDMKSGSIFISPLNFNHSGELYLQIIHRNNSVNNYKYEINVTKADPIKPTAGSSQDTSTEQKKDLAVGLSIFAVAVVAVVAVLVFCGVKRGRIGGNCCCCEGGGNCGDNGVV